MIFGCSDDLKLKISILEMKLELKEAALRTKDKELQECGFKIYNQQREIARLHKTIKELKNEKNS